LNLRGAVEDEIQGSRGDANQTIKVMSWSMEWIQEIEENMIQTIEENKIQTIEENKS